MLFNSVDSCLSHKDFIFDPRFQMSHNNKNNNKKYHLLSLAAKFKCIKRIKSCFFFNFWLKIEIKITNYYNEFGIFLLRIKLIFSIYKNIENLLSFSFPL